MTGYEAPFACPACGETVSDQIHRMGVECTPKRERYYSVGKEVLLGSRHVCDADDVGTATRIARAMEMTYGQS